MIEVALADPHADADSLRAVCERVLAAGAEQERVIEALLTLARSQRGLEERRPFDLAAVVEAALADLGPEPRIEATLEPAATSGDQRLVERLVVNLLDNAVRHNVRGGWVRVRTGVEGERALLRVENSGPMVPADEVGEPGRAVPPRHGGPLVARRRPRPRAVDRRRDRDRPRRGARRPGPPRGRPRRRGGASLRRRRLAGPAARPAAGLRLS